MDLMDCPPSGREARRTQDSREELVERIARAIREDGAVEPLEGLRLNRSSSPTGPVHGVSKPSFCVIAQGSKEVLLADNRYRYDPSRYLIATVGLPIVGQITEASKERPYLSLRLDLDPALVGSVMVEAGHPTPRGAAGVKAIDVSTLDAGLLDAVLRLVGLVDSSADARFLAPMVRREIVYLLLKGEQGGRLSHMAILGGHVHRIAGAVDRLRRDFDRPLRIGDIAREAGMSASTFHDHFKAVAGMSPLQFQKQVRLQEARRLMLDEGLDATSTGHRVGYGDLSHFTREYKRLFGAPPVRDVERLREATMESASL